MKRQEDLLNENYLTTQIRDIKEVRSGEIDFRLEHSNRENSKTIYVYFYRKTANGLNYQKEVRISDHTDANCQCSQMIVVPNEWLTKKKKEQFKSLLYGAIKKLKLKTKYKVLERVGNATQNFIKKENNNG